MKLPNAENATVADLKLAGYLLSTTHKEGKGKASVFFSHGFKLEFVDELRKALKKVATSNPVSKSFETEHGMKFVIEGLLETPDGRGIFLRTIWMIDPGGTIPRFVSAYPV